MVVANAVVGLRVRIVGRNAILLVYSVVAEKEDSGTLEVKMKFSSSSMVVLRLLNLVLKAESIDS